MFCEWTANHVKLYDDNRTLRRQYSVRHPVRSVQVTGEDSLYVGNKRVFDRLKAIAKDPSSELHALWAA